METPPRTRWASLPIVGALLLASTSAGAQPQSDAQRSCIVGVNSAASAVVKAQGKANAACLQQALSAADPALLETCLATASAAVTNARAKLDATAASKCTMPPDFGFTSAATAGTNAVAHDVGLFHDVFGNDLGNAITYGAQDGLNGGCQRSVLIAYEKLLQAELKEFVRCEKAGLKSGTITSAATLAACSSAITVDANGPIAGRAARKLTTALVNRCAGVNDGAAFAGSCQQVGLSECLRRTTACRACAVVNAVDGTQASCDLVDDGIANGSCALCGNGQIDPGELCDDGNTRDGDCCSSHCTVEPAGQTCANDRNACTSDVCDGAGACTHQPLSSCDGLPLHQHVAAANLILVYTKSFVPNAPGGFDDQDPRDRRSIETVVQVDPTIDFDFGVTSGPPGTFFYPYMYSIRWTGGLEAATAGSYAFEVTDGPDGVGRLYIDGALVVEKTAFNTDPVTASTTLTAGRHDIRFDFITYFFGGIARVHWQPPGEASVTPIAPSSLYPVVDGTTSGGLTGTYYATPLLMDKVEQIRKYYRDMRRWVWINSDLQLDAEFDVRLAPAPLNLSRYDPGFMVPYYRDAENRTVWGDILALGLDAKDYASVAAYSPPLLEPDSTGTLGVRQGFYAAGATIGHDSGGPTYSSIQTNIIPADFTEFGLRVANWFGEDPISRYDVYPNNHSFTDFVASAPAGFADSLFFPYASVSFRRPDLEDWKLLLQRGKGFYLGITPDSDGDGIPDGGSDVLVTESDFGSSPGSADTDGDGLTDFAELIRGFAEPTNPLQADTDGDGIPDVDDRHPRFPIEETILPATPVVDGTIGPSEYGSPFVSVSDPDDPSDFGATVWVTWSAAGLNVAIEVVDESVDPVEYDDPSAFTYGGDNVRVRLDLTNDGFLNTPSSLYSDNLEIGVAPTGPNASPRRFAALRRSDVNGYVVDYDTVPGSSIPTAYQLTANGYVVEFLVPANASIGFTPAACMPFSMQVEVYDRDQRQTSAQLRYQLLRESAVAIPHHQDYQADFLNGDGTGGLGAFANLLLADSLGQSCNHAPKVETIGQQVKSISSSRALRTVIRGSDADRDRLVLSATVDGGQPLSSIGATFEDRGIDTGILRWNPQNPSSHVVTVTATDPEGASGQSSFTITAQ